MIGIIPYSRRVIKGMEKILGPLIQNLKKIKKGHVTEEWIKEMNERVKEPLSNALERMVSLAFPGEEAQEFILETDWSGDYSRYMLFALWEDGSLKLVDLGSRVGMRTASFYLGELDTIQWACKRTKAYRGSVPLIIKIDNHGIIEKSKSRDIYDLDIRSFRRWFWIISNELGFKIAFLPGALNQGADLLSKAPKKIRGKSGKHDQHNDQEKDLRVTTLSMGVKVKKLNEGAIIPSRKSAGVVG